MKYAHMKYNDYNKNIKYINPLVDFMFIFLSFRSWTKFSQISETGTDIKLELE